MLPLSDTTFASEELRQLAHTIQCPTFVYELRDPSSGFVRYIGRTKSIDERLRCHLDENEQRNLKLREWIRGLKAVGLAPRMVVVAVCHDWEAEETEKHWVAHHQQSKRLLNISLVSQDGKWFKADDGKWDAGPRLSDEARAIPEDVQREIVRRYSAGDSVPLIERTVRVADVLIFEIVKFYRSRESP